MIVIGVTNFKPITKFEFAIGAMDFIARRVTKWISAMIVVKSSAEDVLPYYLANFVEEDCVRTVPPRVENVALSCVRGIPNLQSNVILAN
jgi:hypothetical protein|mmetsp:Transcript_25451/g.45937  ORF Transcript_25451/g.45937 Transcript_25451/m.45937 type:complete len:90 (-) Transcript_25451:3290-3559(-)